MKPHPKQIGHKQNTLATVTHRQPRWVGCCVERDLKPQTTRRSGGTRPRSPWATEDARQWRQTPKKAISPELGAALNVARRAWQEFRASE